MNAYLLRIIGVVILSAFVTAILPEGKTSGAIRTISRFICILAIVSPVLRFFQSGALSEKGESMSAIFTETVIEAEDNFIEYYSEMRIRQTEESLKKEIFNKFSIDVTVLLSYEYQTETVGEFYNYQKIKITRVYVRLNEDVNEEIVRKLWEYLVKDYCKEVLIE